MKKKAMSHVQTHWSGAKRLENQEPARLPPLGVEPGQSATRKDSQTVRNDLDTSFRWDDEEGC